MFGILQSQSPAKQNATDTINILSSRLLDAVLLEDRRAAILGLRAFAKEYPASVASGALRGLISSLSKEAEDVDTVKVILETLLMLFNPNATSPEASEDITFWLADEFTQRQDNITILLDLLESREFYSRLYSLKLLRATLSARPDRTQECILLAPLGISRLVAILDDKRETIRNEGLFLLTSLTPTSAELQKLVAFENAFERVFALIKVEGSLTNGGIIVQDYLSLLTNLLRSNISNQSFFRETGRVRDLADLLISTVNEQEASDGSDDQPNPQGDQNMLYLLVLLRVFLVPKSQSTLPNQLIFWQHKVSLCVLQIAFKKSTVMLVRTEALLTCADMIRGNSRLQQEFAQIPVPSLTDEPLPIVEGKSDVKTTPLVYVIDGLLDLALKVSQPSALASRLASCECLTAYFANNADIRLHFLKRAIEGHSSGSDETANPLTTLLAEPEVSRSGDPYRFWLSSVLFFHLMHDDPHIKDALTKKVLEGNPENGEEVVTYIQAFSANLITGLERDVDDRISIGYLMLLCGWFFEDPEAVNDFLEEGSSVQSLVQAIFQSGSDKAIIQGLCAVLLGIIYEFSTKDSPIPRAKLHPILASRMGREHYIEKITILRRHPLVRDFDIMSEGQSLIPNGMDLIVYFDRFFIDFLKDNFSRLIRAIDQDPGMEVEVITNGKSKGISRELVDSLKDQLSQKETDIQSANAVKISLESRLGQEQADHRRTKDTLTAELSRVKSVVQGLQNLIDDLKANHQIQTTNLREEHKLFDAREQEKHQEQKQELYTKIQELEKELEKANKNHIQDLQTAHEEFESKISVSDARATLAEERLEESKKVAKESDSKVHELVTSLKNSKDQLAVEKEERKKIQTELEDLLMVLGDLEEKRSRDKERLKQLGEIVSDAEEDEE
ncbi:MAG: hypothetical protein M1829_002645 [Trizodia sp. TS-e1964]|nr:MAG: hypothetical protein M1829_002645 [Trizodia sp. TS-e1964]